MIATLTRIFGIERLDQVEDAVQDAIVRALKLWPYQGAPDNPSAWLIQVAKNLMLDQLRRDSRLTETTDEIEIPIGGDADPAFANEIRDDQLRRVMIKRGLRYLRKSASGDEVSDYHLEAEIAACHALAQSFEDTDWPRVLDSYEELLNRKPSPVVALNRIVAAAKVQGVEAGLVELEKIAEDRTLRNYYPFYATRGELLREAGRSDEAIECYRSALCLTSSEPVRRFLMKRIATLEDRGSPYPR